MTARDLLSPDLLAGVDGIEAGLRRRRNLGRVGAIGLVALFTLQVGVAILGTAKDFDWDSILSQWYIVIPSFLLAAVLVLFVAARYWLRESRTPFRYTCRIMTFDAVPPTPERALPLLRHDLDELLNDRIGRLSFRDTEPVDPEEQEAHLHIAGEYLVREDDKGECTLEVTPRVRVGGANASQSLAHAVRYGLPEQEGAPAANFVLRREHYDKVRERVYFSIASHLYKLIRDDVERKISLLPTRYLRATAYLHEAEDYAQSNTLDAYDDAQELFEQARVLYTPSPARKLLLRIGRRLAKREAMLARAELGLANALVSRRALARLSGRRVNQIFAARAIAERARDRLEKLARRGHAGADQALFDARVTLALTLHYLGSDDRAEIELKCARASLPDRAEESPRYLFVAALLEPRTTSALSLLRRAVELSPRFEVAQFERARRTEALWQFRPELEKTVADTVIAEYMEVVGINPGNIQAWSSLGHTHWLLAEDDEKLEEALRYFRRGLEYKEIKRETFTAGLRYSLARVTAELGQFPEAYGHYVASTTASVGEGIAHGTWAEQHNSVVRNEAILSRFERYVSNVERQVEEKSSGDNSVEPRILRSVKAFVENDYGEACLNFFERTGKDQYLALAQSQYEKAKETNRTYVIPSYNLCLLCRLYGDPAKAQEHITAVLRKEPKWPEAVLEEMLVQALRSREPADEWARLESEIEKHNNDIEDREQRVNVLEKKSRAGDLGKEAQTPAAPRGTGLGADAREIVAPGAAVDHLKAQIHEHENERDRKDERCKEIRARLDVSAMSAIVTVHDLVPHEWLWQGSAQDWGFRWKALRRRRRAFDPRWLRDFGDLHVRALETWAITRAYGRVDESERARLARHLNRTHDLLSLLEAQFWPDRQEALAARLRLKLQGEPQLAERLGSLAARSLAFDPANYQLLRVADDFLSGGDPAQARAKREAFVEAVGQREVASPVLTWLGQRLESLKDYDSALEAHCRALAAYRGAAGQHVDVDEATVLLGKARAEWGMAHYDEAVATLGLVASRDGGESWRTRFVETLADRRQIEAGTPEPEDSGAEGQPIDDNRRRGRLAGIATPRRARRERARSPTPVGEDDAEHHEDEGYRKLVSWLGREHVARVAGGDVSGAFDAACALLCLTAARYERVAPNRTTPLPDVSAPTGDPELDTESSNVPLVRRLALEVHPDVIFDREDLFSELVWKERPAIRARVQAATGVPVPLPSVSRNEFLLPGGFRVLVNELPVAEGRVVDDDGYEAIATVIEEEIRRHLKTLVGVDDIVHALGAMPEDGAEWRDLVLNDDAAKIRLVQTVRRLVVMGMPVDLAEVVGELRDNGAERDIDSIVESIRSRRSRDADTDRAVRPDDPGLQGSSWVVGR